MQLLEIKSVEIPQPDQRRGERLGEYTVGCETVVTYGRTGPAPVDVTVVLTVDPDAAGKLAECRTEDEYRSMLGRLLEKSQHGW